MLRTAVVLTRGRFGTKNPINKKGIMEPMQPQQQRLKDVLIWPKYYSRAPKSTEPKKLHASVAKYDVHVLVCTGSSPGTWPKHVQHYSPNLSWIYKFLTLEVLSIGFPVPTIKVTATDLPNTSMQQGGNDCLLFHKKVKDKGFLLKNVTNNSQNHLLELLQNPTIPSMVPLPHKHHLFACSHMARDERCGKCGPLLFDAINLEITKRNLQNEVAVAQTSHIGGSEFSGNLVCYPKGDWFGKVTPEVIPKIFDSYIEQKASVKELDVSSLWRGRMGMSKGEQEKHVWP